MRTSTPAEVPAVNAELLSPSAVAGAATYRVVRGFFDEVRSGKRPELADRYMAQEVRAHQLTSEQPQVVLRSPANYAEHVRDFLAWWGPFTIEIDELLVDGDRAYVRWTQYGHHVAEPDGRPGSGRPIRETASAVYRVAGERIVEYWIQTDRHGVLLQTSQAAEAESRG